MMHNRACCLGHLTSGGLFLFAIVLYIWSLYPTIAWRDSPEFVTIAHTLDISHPAGSPTYALLAKLATFLPVGSIALRVNFFSALMSAVCVSMVFILLYDLLKSSPLWMRWTAAMHGSLSILVSESLWRFAEVAEVYTLQNAWLIVLILVLLRGRTCSGPLQERYHWLFAFLYGLSAGVHATMALFAPAFLYFVVASKPRLIRSREVAFLSFFFVMGFAVYLYLPIRSLTNPAFDWGDPQTLHQFLVQLLDRKDTTEYAVFSWQKLLYKWPTYLQHIPSEFSIPGCLMGLLGVSYIGVKNLHVCALLTLAFFGHVLFFLNNGWAVAWGYIPSFVIFSLWIGVGTNVCLSQSVKMFSRFSSRLPRIVVQGLLLGCLAVALGGAFLRHVRLMDHAGNYSAETYGKKLIEHLPPHALFLSDYSWFPLIYLQQIERQRPDLTIILQGEVFFPQYFAPISEIRFPNIKHVKTDSPMMLDTMDYFWRLAKLNEEAHQIFWDPVGKLQDTLNPYLHPEGIIFRFHPSKKANLSNQDIVLHKKTMSEYIESIVDHSHDNEAVKVLTKKILAVARYFEKTGFKDEADASYQTALNIKADMKDSLYSYGIFLASNGDMENGLINLMQAYNIESNFSTIDTEFNRNLGILFLKLGENTKAVYFLERAISVGDHDGNSYALLGQAYLNLGQYHRALHTLQTALEKLTQPDISLRSKQEFKNTIILVRDNIRRAKSNL